MARWVTGTRGAQSSPPPSRSTHQEEGQGAGCPQPRARRRRRRRRWGQRTGRTAQEPAGTCPKHISALSQPLQGSGCGGACQPERNTPGSEPPPPPQHPDCRPHAWSSGRRAVGWERAQGGWWWLRCVAKGSPAEPPCIPAAMAAEGPVPSLDRPASRRCSRGWFLPSREGQSGVVSGSFPTHADFSKMITFNSKPKQLFLRGGLIYRGGKKPKR